MTIRQCVVCGFLCFSLILLCSTTWGISREEETSSGPYQTTLGLKELLNIGILNAVKLVGIEDGYYKNEAIKILMPEKLKKVDTFIRKFGGKELSDTLIKKMNRTAEKAAPLAKDIFIEAIKNIKFHDVRSLLSGKENAATEFLETNTSETLKSTFYPIVKKTMEEIEAIKAYNQYIGKYSSNPFTKSLGLELDISQYVTDKAIDGLFIMVAKEEKKIREDPVARVTDLLKSLFGKKKKVD